jgi:hypothetical protein
MAFQYDELKKSKSQIRLIRFRRNGKTPIEISLSTVSKDENPDYHCLSYVWGDPTPTWPVVVNDTQILVNYNLGEALQRVEKEQDVEFLWADALCINQKDEDEKLHQVHMMNKIYSEAIAVVAWLGPEADSSGAVMDEVSRVGGIVVRHLLHKLYPEGAIDDMLAAPKMGGHKLELFMLDWIEFPIDSDGIVQRPEFWDDIGWDHSEHRMSLKAWSAFCLRSYWTRIWILQELAVSRDAYVLCGDRRNKLCFFLAILRFTQKLFTAPHNDSDTMSEWMIQFALSYTKAPILKCLRNFIGDASYSDKELSDLLTDSGAMEATVPQDRIFALAALTTEDLGIDFTYSKSLLEYLEDITRNKFLRKGIQIKPLDIDSCSWASGSPSWVAYGNQPFSINTLASMAHRDFFSHHGVLEGRTGQQVFRACGQSPFIPFES